MVQFDTAGQAGSGQARTNQTGPGQDHQDQAPRGQTRPSHTRPGARQIYLALKAQISEGIFDPSRPLPSTRSLAGELGVARTTVTVAYEQLAAEGFIQLRIGARPLVIAAPKASGATPLAGGAPVTRRLSAFGQRAAGLWAGPPAPRGDLLADFRYGDLALPDFPAQIWKRAMNAALSPAGSGRVHDDPRGSARLRQALQGYLWRARGLECRPGQILIVNGSQQGLDLCARVFLGPGDRVLIENPGYAMARQVLAATGAVPVPVPVDAEGMQTADLAALSRSGAEAKSPPPDTGPDIGPDTGPNPGPEPGPAGAPRLAYVTPAHQFPLGGVMPVTRRHQLLDWAGQTGACILEDDYDSEYRYDTKPVPPLYTLRGGSQVVYLGTISKTLSPALRIGYLVVPEDLVPAFAGAKQLMDRHSPLTEQEALATLIGNGSYETHVRRMRRQNAERRAALLEALRAGFGGRVRVEGAEAGLHLVAWFRDVPAAASGALAAAARVAGVGIHPVLAQYDPAAGGLPDRAGFVLGYAALSPERIRAGIARLARVVADVPAWQSTRAIGNPRPEA